MKSKILISTGGSGGHVLPAITIYDHLKSNYETLISTDLRGLRYLDKENYKHIIINTPKFNNFEKRKYFNFDLYWWLHVLTIMFGCKNIKY